MIDTVLARRDSLSTYSVPEDKLVVVSIFFNLLLASTQMVPILYLWLRLKTVTPNLCKILVALCPFHNGVVSFVTLHIM